jgi:hypothetical protein
MIIGDQFSLAHDGQQIADYGCTHTHYKGTPPLTSEELQELIRTMNSSPSYLGG